MRNEKNRQQMLEYIDAVSFSQYEAALFLDTHPCNREAMEYFEHFTNLRNKALKEYADRFGALTFDTAPVSRNNKWSWVETPFPWELGGAC